MKKMIAILATIFVAQMAQAIDVTINNKTKLNVKVIFDYTSIVCHKDSRQLAPGASTGLINTGACMFHELTAEGNSNGKTLIGKMTNIARYAPGSTIYEVTEHPDGTSLIIKMIDANGNVLHWSPNYPQAPSKRG